MITIDALSFGYPRNRTLFTNLDLHLSPGNVYGLLGKNGAGKTTLLKLIAGLLFPHGGGLEVLGFSPCQRSPLFLRELFFIPEEFYLPPIRLAEYLRLYAPFYPRFDRARFNQYRDDFQLADDDRLAALSYGQKKKFLLAFGLATDCRLLLLDEPTNGLDIPTKSQFRKLLAGAISDERTFIVSTHQVRDMERLIDPIIILDEGRIIFQASLAEVTERLVLRIRPTEPAAGAALYAEKVLGGYAVLEENPSAADSKIDLEVLFNAVIGNRARIGEIFSREVKHAR